MKQDKTDLQWKHDLMAPVAKMKTAVALMKGASAEEIQAEYLPLLKATLNEMDNELKNFFQTLNKS